MKHLQLRNAQRARPVKTRLLRQAVRFLLERLLGLARYELAIQIVSAPRMAVLNQAFLNHEGSTDVITFDYREGYEDAAGGDAELRGEIFISADDAASQALEFHTIWQEELVRCIVHGVLHLRGFDDLDPARRKVMKREENRLLKALAREFSLGDLAG